MSAKTPPKTPPESPAHSPTRAPPQHTEQTPLLAGQAEEGRDEHEEAALLEPPQNEAKRTRGWWFWRILWAVLAALVLAVFIKGWVDAEDVDVSIYLRLMPDPASASASACTTRSLHLLTEHCSSTSEAPSKGHWAAV